MKNMLETMEVLGLDPQAEVGAEHERSDPPTNATSSSYAGVSSSTSPRKGYQAITAGPQEAAELTPSDKPTKKGKGLTPEQKQKLALMQQEQENVRKERVTALSQKLLEKISVWTETDRSSNVTEAFKTKMQVFPLSAIKSNRQYEAEIMKLESFGVDLLHTIGLIYTQKATTFLKSKKFLGLGGVWFRTKEKGTLVKSAWGTVSSAVDAGLAGKKLNLNMRSANLKADKVNRIENEGKHTEEELVELMMELSGDIKPFLC